MIVFDLECREGGHRFEGWFGSSDDFARQQNDGLLACPFCGAGDVAKAVMAPNVGRKGNQLPVEVKKQDKVPVAAPIQPLPPEAVAMLRAIATAQAEALKHSRWVGDDFADTVRAQHYGDADIEPIHGEATLEDAEELRDEGIEIAPILFPVAPPNKTN